MGEPLRVECPFAYNKEDYYYGRKENTNDR